MRDVRTAIEEQPKDKWSAVLCGAYTLLALMQGLDSTSLNDS